MKINNVKVLNFVLIYIPLVSKSLKCRQPELIDLPKTTDYEVVEMTTLEDPTTRPKVNSTTGELYTLNRYTVGCRGRVDKSTELKL